MILALDLDDTLLRSDKTIGERTLAALRRWLDAGHEVVVATGRPPRFVDAALPPDLRQAVRITYNGAHVIADGNVIYRNELSPDDVRAIVEWTAANRPHWNIGLEIEDELYLNRASSKPGKYTVADLGTLCDRPAAKVIFYFAGEQEDMTALLAALPATARALITPKFSMVQLCGHKTDKADALAHLLAQRGLDFDAVVAIGDDVNDIEMVRRAAIGIAVDNALDEVKAVADWITAAADADGVADAIERLLPMLAQSPDIPANHHVATQPILESGSAA